MRSLRVATLNIWNRQGPWDRRLAIIRQRLAELAPDLLALQEVVRGDGSTQADEIAAGLGYHVAYAPASDYGGGVALGNALLSRFPIVESEGVALPGSEETHEARGALVALVDAPCGRVPMMVTHLAWKLHHGSARVQQVRFLAELVRTRFAPRGRHFPAILAGDLNAEPDAEEMRFLRGLATLEGRSAFFADAWVYAGDGPGFTFDRRRNAYAALGHEPPRRIDYVLVFGPQGGFVGEPLSARLAFDEPDETENGPVWASDHFGVVAELAAETRRDPTP